MGAEAHTTRLSVLISSHGTRVKLARAQVIQTSDTANKVLLLKKGYVKRYLILNDGTVRVQIIYGSGDIFPLTIAYKVLLNQDLYNGPEVYYYETMSDVEIYTIANQDFVKLFKGDDQLYKELFSEAGRRLYFNIQRLENLGLQNSYNRVAHQLAFLARIFGEKKETGTRICIQLTHKDIADVLNVTRETVTVAMVTLRKKNLIKPGKSILVPSVSRLSREAFI